MKEGQPIRDLFNNPEAANFVYRPPNAEQMQARNATIGVKFGQGRVILDDWNLFGGTKWTRFLFRLKHPIIYSGRGLRSIYRKIKSWFVKGRTIPCTPLNWLSEEEMIKIQTEVKNGRDQKQKSAAQQD